MSQEELSNESLFAMTAAEVGSGVRARWVELPDCNNEGPLPEGEISLKDDLSNAVIATCKSYGVTHDRWGRLTQYEGNPTERDSGEKNNRDIEQGIWEGLGKDAYDKLPVYDPINREEGATDDYGWPTRYSGGRIPSHEHQVTQQAPGHWEDGNTEHPAQQLGTVEATHSINPNGDEPVGDWQHLTGGGFMYSEEEWDTLPDLEPHNSDAAPAVNDNAKEGPDYSLLQLNDDVLTTKQQFEAKYEIVGDGKIPLTTKDPRIFSLPQYQLVKLKGTDKKFQAKIFPALDVEEFDFRATMAAREIDFMSAMHNDNIESAADVITSKKFSDVPTSMQQLEKNADPPILITEFNEGGDLRTLINWMEDNNQTFAESTLLEMMYQTLSALQYAHSLGIAHREVMPENLHITNDFQTIKLAEFRFSEKAGNKLMQDNENILSYTSPEILSAQKYDNRIDMYGLGLSLYEAAALKNPFKSKVDKTQQAVTYGAILFEQVPDLGTAYSDEFKQAISQMMDKDFQKRPTAKQMLESQLMKHYAEERAKTTVEQQKLFTVYGHKMLAAEKTKK